MHGPSQQREETRSPLTRERVIAAALSIADRKGVTAVTMRQVAKILRVEAMSLYHHVSSKDAILDGMVDRVFGEIGLPPPTEDWKPALHTCYVSAREALARHPWAVGLMDSRRNPGSATLRHHDAVIGCLRSAGFSIPMAGHGIAVLDSYLYGFAVQEQALPFNTPKELEDVAESIFSIEVVGQYPHLAELASKHVLRPGYAFGDEFQIGLDLILEGLERLLFQAEVGT
jgi:hypothetical protein